MVDDSQNEWTNAFRSKSTYMKTWKPLSTPSNRDRLELYALHKQSVQGDAPAHLSTSGTPSSSADQAKYQAWRRMSGLSRPEAMKLYCQEAERQIRVYGVSQPPPGTNNAIATTMTANGSSSGGGVGSMTVTPARPAQQQTPQTPHGTPATADGAASNIEHQPRGLAAIPLLCAAASESRQAYLRRLAQTATTHAWWKRQEPLTATPGSLGAVGEQALLWTATAVEHVSLLVNNNNNNNNNNNSLLPAAVIQSFLWPWHNSFLCLWMAIILVSVATQAAVELLWTVLLGSRRSGYTLQSVWKDQVVATAQSIQSLTAVHQPVSARLVGLGLWPASAVILHGIDQYLASSVLTKSIVYTVLFVVTWWYWFLVLPVAAFWWLFWAGVAGGCFALIELAGV